MDPFFKPVMTLIEPFIVHKYNEREKDTSKARFPPGARKSFDFDSKCYAGLLSDKNIIDKSTRQMNCVV